MTDRRRTARLAYAAALDAIPAARAALKRAELRVASAHAEMSAATKGYAAACLRRDTEQRAYAETLGAATHAAVASVAARDAREPLDGETENWIA